jgi:hypothetical protein
MIRTVLHVPKTALRRQGAPVVAAYNSPNMSIRELILRTAPSSCSRGFNKFSLLPRVGVAIPPMPSGSFLFASGLHLGMNPRVLGSINIAARIYSSQPPKSPRSRLASGIGMVGAGGMLLLGKGKYLIGALKLTKFASLGSMLLSVGAYTAFCKWNTYFICFQKF